MVKTDSELVGTVEVVESTVVEEEVMVESTVVESTVVEAVVASSLESKVGTFSTSVLLVAADFTSRLVKFFSFLTVITLPMAVWTLKLTKTATEKATKNSRSRMMKIVKIDYQ